MTTIRPKVALIAGPTASGKSALALSLAEQAEGRGGGTIINADSAQVYRDLRILTARPTPEEEARVPHRLFGHVDAADTGYSAARWAAEAREAIAATVAQRRLPILVGGTGLYLRTLLDGIAQVPPIDPTIRADVRALPVAAAHADLARLDAAGAARLHPHDTTRVARALEVVRSTGRPLAQWQGERSGGIGTQIDLAAVVLLPDRAALYARIEARAAAMLDGAAREVAELLARDDVPPDAPVRRAIGVSAFAALLSGDADRTCTGERLVQDTRRYAKRQITWLRHQTPLGWFLATDYSSENLEEVIKLLEPS